VKQIAALKRSLVGRLPAGVFSFLRQVVAHEERSFEQLDADDGEDELEQKVDDHDDEDILDRVDQTVKHHLSTQIAIKTDLGVFSTLVASVLGRAV